MCDPTKSAIKVWPPPQVKYCRSTVAFEPTRPKTQDANDETSKTRKTANTLEDFLQMNFPGDHPYGSIFIILNAPGEEGPDIIVISVGVGVILGQIKFKLESDAKVPQGEPLTKTPSSHIVDELLNLGAKLSEKCSLKEEDSDDKGTVCISIPSSAYRRYFGNNTMDDATSPLVPEGAKNADAALRQEGSRKLCPVRWFVTIHARKELPNRFSVGPVPIPNLSDNVDDVGDALKFWDGWGLHRHEQPAENSKGKHSRDLEHAFASSQCDEHHAWVVLTPDRDGQPKCLAPLPFPGLSECVQR